MRSFHNKKNKTSSFHLHYLQQQQKKRRDFHMMREKHKMKVITMSSSYYELFSVFNSQMISPRMSLLKWCVGCIEVCVTCASV